MYERLTKRDKYGHAYTNETIYDRGMTSEDGVHYEKHYFENGTSAYDGKPIDRLCEIEDKICEGKMVELPCGVGTSVWFVTCVCDEIGKEKYDALEGEVISFSMQKYELWVYCHYKCGLTYWHTIDGFKADVFLAPEEANKKLKELENEQR